MRATCQNRKWKAKVSDSENAQKPANRGWNTSTHIWVFNAYVLRRLTLYQKADDKIFVCKFSKNVKSKLYHIENSIFYSVDLVEVAHYKPPHQDLRCLQIQLFSSLVLKELNQIREGLE